MTPLRASLLAARPFGRTVFLFCGSCVSSYELIVSIEFFGGSVSCAGQGSSCSALGLLSSLSNKKNIG